MPENPDIIENTLRRHPELLEILLLDRTRQMRKNELAKRRKDKTPRVCNILWATDSYPEHPATAEILVQEITGENTFVIQPRITKSREEQKKRVKDKAEVFTPREIVEEMNKQIDWASENFPATRENWRDYVREPRLEITCGEAPFIVGRYNAATGKKVLKLSERVGFLDRKMQVVGKFYKVDEGDGRGLAEGLAGFSLAERKFIYWSKIAYQSSYGYEWQGDSLLLARENLLYTFVDYWNAEFPKDKINLERKLAKRKLQVLREFAEIISWNIFQMDGLKYVVPMSGASPVPGQKSGRRTAKQEAGQQMGLFDLTKFEVVKKSVKVGIPVQIVDWQAGKTVEFWKLLGQGK